jgi:DNA-binding response OmpR family regulator
MIEPSHQDNPPKTDGFMGKKILVVDDNELVCEMIAKILMKYLDLEVFKIKGGNQAITAALTGRYNGAIIDLALEGTSSSKVIRTIRTMLPGFPILAMCSHPTEDQMATLSKHGISRIIHKPFKMITLIDEITEILGADKPISVQS